MCAVRWLLGEMIIISWHLDEARLKFFEESTRCQSSSKTICLFTINKIQIFGNVEMLQRPPLYTNSFASVLDINICIKHTIFMAVNGLIIWSDYYTYRFISCPLCSLLLHCWLWRKGKAVIGFIKKLSSYQLAILNIWYIKTLDLFTYTTFTNEIYSYAINRKIYFSVKQLSMSNSIEMSNIVHHVIWSIIFHIIKS